MFLYPLLAILPPVLIGRWIAKKVASGVRAWEARRLEKAIHRAFDEMDRKIVEEAR